jgi:hypothetical protein
MSVANPGWSAKRQVISIQEERKETRGVKAASEIAQTEKDTRRPSYSGWMVKTPFMKACLFL